MVSCTRVKNGNRRLAWGENEVQRIWEDYFRNLHNIDTQEKVAVHIFGFEPIGKAEVEVRVGKLKNGKAIGKESGVVPDNWRSAVIVPLYKGKGGRTECKD